MAANDGGSGPVKPNWHDKIIKKTRSNLVFNADSFKGDKQTIIQVTLAPNGVILSRTLTTSSGDANWDQAVLSAIDNMQTFPKDDNGQIPIYDVTLKFKPR
jgi:colicin import membrane protein